MNCISASGNGACFSPSRPWRRWLLVGLLFAITACDVASSESTGKPVERDYKVHFTLRPDPVATTVDVVLRVTQSRGQLRELTFPRITEAMSEFDGDGELEFDDASLSWRPPRDGGTLSWRVRVAHEREGGGFDAWLGPEWGLFRAEDVIPRARSRSLKRSLSQTSLSFDLPRGWSVVTEYRGSNDAIPVRRPDRRFDLPTGWIVIGDLGVRRETIAGVKVAIAGPQGQTIRRMDMLALLNWTLPELVALLPEPPARLTIVSAGDPMWRGGLSAPASLYLHAERPLISENATSALLHEVLHTTLSLRSAPGMDWIVEGFAEYYSLELLRRGGAITAHRHTRAMQNQAEWAQRASVLCGDASTGATTARAVTLFRALDNELRERSGGKKNLDDLLHAILVQDDTVTATMLAEIATDLGGQSSDVLHIDNLPGCHKLAARSEGD